MSLLNATYYDSFGMISTDSLGYLVSDDIQKKFLSTPENHTLDYNFSRGTGRTPSPPAKCWYMSKITALPHMQSIYAYNGNFNTGKAVDSILTMNHCDDIADFKEQLTHNLSLIDKQMENLGFSSLGVVIGFIIGWSKKNNKIIGWKFSSIDGYQPEVLPDECQLAPPNIDDDHFLELEESFAQRGNSLEQEKRLHIAICENQYRTYQKGKYPEIFHCNNKFQIASVTRNQIVFYRK
ncbi:MAG: hypothetical protein ACK502_00715 [Alphaproteobacteria bacterium]